MKPSQRIKEIKNKLMEEGVGYESQADFRAIIQYLDEEYRKDEKTEEDKVCKNCGFSSEIGANGKCWSSVCKGEYIISLNSMQDTNKWEEEFDKKWDQHEREQDRIYPLTGKDLKDFIADLLASRLEELKGRIEKEKRTNTTDDFSPKYLLENKDWNAALDKALEIINKLES